MNWPTFQREFLKLATINLACHLRAMGGSIPGITYGTGPVDLPFQLLGIVDYSNEMRLLCREARARGQV
jgi:hypothetical protein